MIESAYATSTDIHISAETSCSAAYESASHRHAVYGWN